MKIDLPDLALVVLVGVSGSGKSTFARRHFKPTEILTSDFCRALVADDENDQSATRDAFEILHFIAARRLVRGRLTVVDATNVQPEARKPLVELAREHYVLPVAIVFDLPENLIVERSRAREDRDVGLHVLRNQRSQLRRSLRDLQREGFRHVWIFRTPEEVEAATIERRPLWPDRRSERGPFDLIGDIHGCGDELEELLAKLGYAPDESGVHRHPENRKVVFLGDLVDRGPRVPDVLRIVMGMVSAGTALCVPGNHDEKLLRWLRGKNVKLAHGLQQSIEQIEREPPEFRQEVSAFLDSLISHYVLDGGRLVAAHAGMKEEMQGRASGRVREFALYGETTGEMDELGLPVRLDWAAEYRGTARSTATPRSRSRAGSIARSTSTPAASSAAPSPPCATPSWSWSPCPPARPTRAPRAPSCRRRATGSPRSRSTTTSWTSRTSSASARSTPVCATRSPSARRTRRRPWRR